MPRIAVAVGVAPRYAAQYDDQVEQAIREAFGNRYVKAVGSCGLTGACTEAEVRAFERQIALARELERPLVVEAAGAYDQAFEVVQRVGWPERVVLRAFGGTAEQLARWVEAGSFISFGAEAENDPVTACKLAKLVPADKILAESGAPDDTLLVLGGSDARSDQVVFVVDALQGARPAPLFAENFQRAFLQ